MIIKLGFGKLNMTQIAAFTGGYLVGAGDCEVDGICTDSREAAHGILFTALRGERSDGHDFIPAAFKLGCRAVIAERHDGLISEGMTAVIVPDSQRALMDIAAACRDTRCLRVAITGSVGKTTTKEFVSSVLNERYRTHKTYGNFNSLIGMPLSMLQTPDDAEVSVLEFAMSGMGEIRQMSDAARPDIALITNIGTSHMEMLGSRENICRAKFEIVSGLREDGLLILNGDEPMMWGYCGKPARTVYVAIKNGRADYVACGIRSDGMDTLFNILAGGREFSDIRIPALGYHNVYAAAFAWALGEALGLSEEEIRRGLLSYRSADMRQRIYDMGGVTIIEDCYNAGPESMRAAIDVLCGLDGEGRRIALLGDMRELGASELMYHRSTGAYAAERGVDILFTIGALAGEIAAGAVAAGMNDDNIYVNIDENTYAATADELAEVIRPGDKLLVKASRAVRAERVIECLALALKK